MTVAELLASPRYKVLPSTVGSLRRKSGEGVALAQQLQWWLHHWAGWPQPNVTVIDEYVWHDPARHAVVVSWRCSDGRTLRHLIDGLALHVYARTDGYVALLINYEAVARELAKEVLQHRVNIPPWELPRS